MRVSAGRGGLVFALVFALFALQSGPAVAADGSLNLAPHVEYLEDPTGALELADVRGHKDFRPLPHGEHANFGYSGSTYWLRFPLPGPDGRSSDWILEVAYFGLRHVAVHAPGQPAVVTGLDYGFDSRPLDHRHFVFPLEAAPSGDEGRVYLQVRNDRSLTVPLYLWRPEAFAAANGQAYVAHGLYAGLALALALYNLLLYFSLRERSYLVYVLFVVALATGVLAMSGLVNQHLWARLPWEFPSTSTLALSLAGVFGMWFARRFLQTAQSMPRLEKALVGVTLLFAINAVLVFAREMGALRQGWLLHAPNLLLSLAGVIACILVIVAGVMALRGGRRDVRFFLAAWLVLVSSILIGIMRNFDWVPTNVLTSHTLQVGSALEMLLLAFALADRIQRERRARERAQDEALDARQMLVERLAENERSLEQRVVERTEELRQARDRAEQADRAKAAFLGNVSHEVRTPLSGILGAARLGLEDAADEKQAHYLRSIERSGENLLHLINDLLDVSRIQSGALVLDHAPFRLDSCTSAVYTALDLSAATKGVEFRCRLEDGVPSTLVGDRTRLTQVLMNLAGNAVKFTDAGEVVLEIRRLAVTGEQVRLRFSVRDTGIGIRPERRHELFRRFSQLHDDSERREGGAGLGLAIAHDLVERMGGHIEVESTPGKGSVFCFDLWLEVADDAWRPTAEDQSDGGLPLPLRSSRVLVAEDDPLQREILHERLTRMGLQVECVDDGEAALHKLRSGAFDLLLLDMQMPVLDGRSTVARLREDETLQHLPVVAMSAHARESDREAGLAAGMDAYLTKPMVPEDLAAELCRLLPGGSAAAAGSGPAGAKERQSRASPPEPWDRGVALCYYDNREDLVRRVLVGAQDQARSLQYELERVPAGALSADLLRSIHSLRGNASSLGGVELSTAAAALEDAVRKGGTDAGQLEALRQALVDALKRFAPEHDSGEGRTHAI